MTANAAQTYGSRFLLALRKDLQGTAGLSFAAIEAASTGDRAAVNALLRRHIRGLPYRVNQVLDSAEPEDAAAALAAELRARVANGDTAAMLLFASINSINTM